MAESRTSVPLKKLKEAVSFPPKPEFRFPG